MTESKDFSHGFHIFMDGNMWCAVGPHFRNLQEDRAGFGETPQAAYEAWWKDNEHGSNFRAVVHSKPDFSEFTLTHPEAQGNKDLGEPAASGLEEENRRLREALTKLDTLMDFSEPFRPGHNVSMFEDVDAINAAMAEASELLQAQRVAQAAPTSPQPIKGESELESASNGMGLR